MSFQDDPNLIRWRLYLKMPNTRVFQALSTDAGRASFWAESAMETNGVIQFVFPNQMTWDAHILESIPPKKYVVQYFGNSITAFTLEEDGEGGTILSLTDAGVPIQDRTEVIAGWVSVLMNLKAVVEFGVDLRNHDVTRQWDNGFVEN